METIFILVGDEKELKGTIVQKFPDQDWKDAPSPQGLQVVGFFIVYCLNLQLQV